MPENVEETYAHIKVATEQQGTPLDECDLWIAATALVLDAILVTSDSDFQRIAGRGLRLEDWVNYQEAGLSLWMWRHGDRLSDWKQTFVVGTFLPHLLSGIIFNRIKRFERNDTTMELKTYQSQALKAFTRWLEALMSTFNPAAKWSFATTEKQTNV